MPILALTRAPGFPAALAHHSVLTALSILVLATLAGCAAPTQTFEDDAIPPPTEPSGLPEFATDGACPGHWHTVFDLYVDDEKVTFPKPPYALDGEGGKMPHRMHMHRNEDDNKLHYQPGAGEPQCLRVPAAFKLMDVDVKPTRIELSGQLSKKGTWTGEGNEGLHTYVETPDAPWTEYDPTSVLNVQMPDGARLLLVFGAVDEDRLATMMDEVASP